MAAVDVLLETARAFPRHGAAGQGQRWGVARQKTVPCYSAGFLAALPRNNYRHGVIRMLRAVVIDRRRRPLSELWLTAGNDRQQLPDLHEARVARRESLVNKDKCARKRSKHGLDALHRFAQILQAAREGKPHMARRPKARAGHYGNERVVQEHLSKLVVVAGAFG